MPRNHTVGVRARVRVGQGQSDALSPLNIRKCFTLVVRKLRVEVLNEGRDVRSATSMPGCEGR